jgi:hypothetical protein
MLHPTPVAQQPSQNYLLGVPALQSTAAGFLQGPRTVAQTTTGWASDLDKAYPEVAQAGYRIGAAVNPYLPGFLQQPTSPLDTRATNQNLTGQSTLNEQRYGADPGFQAAKISGELAATYPVMWAAKPFEALSEIPYAGRVLAPGTQGAVGGGLQNALTSPGQDPGQAVYTGAIGGAAVGGNKSLMSLPARRGCPRGSRSIQRY